MDRERRTALVVIDVQKAFDEPGWGNRNNPACEANIARLISLWRDLEQPIVYVQHDSRSPESSLSPMAEGHAFKPEITGQPDVLVRKSVHSAFHGHPSLDDWLRRNDVSAIAIAGIQTNHCCETTARLGADLGYAVTFVLDATHSFDRTALDGSILTADELARTTAANLNGEFASVVNTDDLIDEMGRSRPRPG